MTRDDIIRMAREAGFVSAEYWPNDFKGLASCVERFAALVAAAEREACARMCDGIALKYKHPDDVAERVASEWCADDIRARGNNA